MHTHRTNLKWFMVASLAIIAAITGLCLLLEPSGPGRTTSWGPLCPSSLKGVFAATLILVLATLMMQRSLREGKGSERKFQGLLEAAPDAILIMDKDSRITLVNTQTEKLFGYSREELLGQPVDLVIRKEVRQKPGSNELSSFSHADLSLGTSTDPTLRAPEPIGRHKDGTEFPLEISFNPLETEDGLFIINSIRDISERQTRERRRAARHAVRRILLETSTLNQVAPRLLATICQNLGWDVALLWVVNRNPAELRCRTTWTAPDLDAPELVALSREQALAPETELPGQVWASGAAAWVTDISPDAFAARMSAAVRGGCTAAWRFPSCLGPRSSASSSSSAAPPTNPMTTSWRRWASSAVRSVISSSGS